MATIVKPMIKGKGQPAPTPMVKTAVEQGEVIEINRRATSMAEAERVAKTELRRVNKNEVTGTLNLQGDIRFIASVTISLRGFGYFDGRYMIEKATHTVSGGYRTSLEVRRVLEGY